MENKLEQLLNSLIEKGFRPFNIPEITEIKYISTKNKLRITSHQNNRDYKDDFSLRDIVSKSSGLWQFVCDNGMVKNEKLTHNWVSQVEWGLDVDCKRKTTPKDYEYRVIESALRDESELEQFLLGNILIS